MQGPSSASGSHPSPNEIREGPNFKKIGLFDELTVGRYYFILAGQTGHLGYIANKGVMHNTRENAVGFDSKKKWVFGEWQNSEGERNVIVIRESMFDSGRVEFFYMEQRGPTNRTRKSRRQRKGRRGLNSRRRSKA